MKSSFLNMFYWH